MTSDDPVEVYPLEYSSDMYHQGRKKIARLVRERYEPKCYCCQLGICWQLPSRDRSYFMHGTLLQ